MVLARRVLIINQYNVIAFKYTSISFMCLNVIEHDSYIYILPTIVLASRVYIFLQSL